MTGTKPDIDIVDRLVMMAGSVYVTDKEFIARTRADTVIEAADEITRLRTPQWQDISTAPRDGTIVDVFGNRSDDGPARQPRRITGCSYRRADPYCGDFNEEWLTSDGWKVSFTYWMHTPTPPVGE